MKLIHTSDLHIGSPLTARLPHDKTVRRRRELISTFRAMIEEGEKIGAEGMIIAGDLFDSEKVGRRTAEEVAEAMASAPEMTFFYLPGNHERSAFADAGVALPQNLRFFDTGWTYFDFHGVRIVGRQQTAADMFADIPMPGAGRCIAVLHGELRDRSAAGGVIGERDLPGDLDLLCLGHYHSYSEKAVGPRTRAVYCGTPEGRGFDEAGECGFVLIEIDDRAVTTRFIPFARRRMRLLSVDISGAESLSDVYAALEAALAGVPGEDLVRAVLCGRVAPELDFDADALTDRFADRFFYFEVRDETRLILDPERYRYDPSLKGELIRLVSADQTLSEEDRKAVILCGLRALAGEE